MKSGKDRPRRYDIEPTHLSFFIYANWVCVLAGKPLGWMDIEKT